MYATQEAEAIFGDVDELLAVYEERKYARAATAGEEEGLDEEEEDEGLDEEEAEARRLARVRCCRRCCCRSVCWVAGLRKRAGWEARRLARFGIGRAFEHVWGQLAGCNRWHQHLRLCAPSLLGKRATCCCLAQSHRWPRHRNSASRQEEKARAAAERRMREQLDPEALAHHYLLPQDEQIR